MIPQYDPKNKISTPAGLKLWASLSELGSDNEEGLTKAKQALDKETEQVLKEHPLEEIETKQRGLAPSNSQGQVLLSNLEHHLRVLAEQRDKISSAGTVEDLGSGLDLVAAAQALDQVVKTSNKVKAKPELIQAGRELDISSQEILIHKNSNLKGPEEEPEAEEEKEPEFEETNEPSLLKESQQNRFHTSSGQEYSIQSDMFSGTSRYDFRTGLEAPAKKETEKISPEELAAKQNYVHNNFPGILASGDIDQIILALAYVYTRPLYFEKKISKDIKAIFNRNSELKDKLKGQFTQALKQSAELRSKTRAYLNKYSRLYRNQYDYDDFIEHALHEVMWSDRELDLDQRVVSQLHCFEDLSQMDLTELRKIFGILLETSDDFGYTTDEQSRFFLVNLIKVLEQRLEDPGDNQQELQSFLDLSLDVIEQSLTYDKGTERPLLAENIRLVNKYRPKKYEEALTRRLINYGVYEYFTEPLRGQALANAMADNNPAPRIFDLSPTHFRLTDAFKQKVLKSFKQHVIDNINNDDGSHHSIETSRRCILRSTGYLREFGIDTRALFTDAELETLLKNGADSVMLYDVSDPKYQELLKHDIAVSGINPFSHRFMVEHNHHLVNALSTEGEIERQTVTDDFLSEMVDKNIKGASTHNAGQACQMRAGQLFETYLDTDEKKLLLMEHEEGAELLDEIENLFGFNLDDIYNRREILTASVEQKNRICDLVDMDHIVEDLNNKLAHYLYGVDNFHAIGYLRDLSTVIPNQETFHEELKHILSNKNDTELKQALEKMFRKRINGTEIESDFFRVWKTLRRQSPRILAALIIRGEGESITNSSTKFSLPGFFTNLDKNISSIAESLDEKSVFRRFTDARNHPIIIKRLFGKNSSVFNKIFTEHFGEQEKVWHRAKKFYEERNRSLAFHDQVNLLNSKAKIGFVGASPAFLAGSGEYVGSREYAQGDDTRHIDWRLTELTGKVHTKSFVDDIDLRPKEYLIDIESLAETRSEGVLEQTESGFRKVESLVLYLYNNYMHNVRQNLRLVYKGRTILELNKLDLVKIFSGQENSWINDSYGRRNKFMDFYCSLKFLGYMAQHYTTPYHRLEAPIISDIWKPADPLSQVIVLTDRMKSIKLAFEDITKWTKQGAEVLKLELEPQNFNTDVAKISRRRPLMASLA